MPTACAARPWVQEEEKYSVTWRDALARDDVETVEDPLHQTATAKHVFNDVYGA
jgi:hypothetical protein